MDSGFRPVHQSQALSRREFLRGAAGAGLAGAGVVLLGGCGSDDGKGSPTSTPGIVADPPPETTTIRLGKHTLAPWVAPILLAEQFLPPEGFTNVQYIDVTQFSYGSQPLAAGEVDLTLEVAPSLTVAADAGRPLVILAGVASSEFVLHGNDRVQSLRDLKGKRVWVVTQDEADASYTLWAALLAYIGIKPSEVEYVALPLAAELGQQVVDGTLDAWVGIRPYSTALRDANIGHVMIDGAIDPPWSQYFGPMVAANRDFLEKHPAATKRALRAILKAADMCAREPERAARYLVDRGFTPFAYDEALDAITDVSLAAWREFDPEDTMRFYALRLKEAGLVKSSPDELIARATDWRYLNEIKRELGVA